jgi:G3E family GTPase
VRADSFVVSGVIHWAGLAAFMDALREFFGRRLLRCKGLIEIAELGRPVLVQGVQAVFAAPLPLPAWPDDDRRSRLVCISRDLPRRELEACLPLLQAEAGTFRPASLEELLK